MKNLGFRVARVARISVLLSLLLGYGLASTAAAEGSSGT